MREFNKLFVVSLPRCATVSVHQALGMLGIRTAHLGKIYGETRESDSQHHDTLRLAEMLGQIKAGSFRFGLLDHCDGLADYPACCLSVIEKLDQTYPGSLFINVRRDRSISGWLQSIESHFVGMQLLQQSQSGQSDCGRESDFVSVLKQFRRMTFGASEFSVTAYSSAYRNHQDQIARMFAGRDRLLSFEDVSQLSEEGFVRLCKFLKIETVPKVEFPCNNLHSDQPRRAFMSAIRAGLITSQTGITDRQI